jgi:DNA-binding beta-propeller fold protein YncE
MQDDRVAVSVKCILLATALLLLCGGVAIAGATETYVFDGEWGSQGLENGLFSYPCDIALDGAGSVYVADQDNDRAQKFTTTGSFLAVMNAAGLGIPQGVTVSAGRVYVSGADGIRIYSTSGTGLGEWGATGTRPGELQYPRGMAVDWAGRIYVADWGNNRIQAFWPNGTRYAVWGAVRGRSPSRIPGTSR